MGHLATGPTELREAVGQGALEKESSDMGGSPLAEGTEAGLRPHLLFSVLAAERKECWEQGLRGGATQAGGSWACLQL